jgi:ABC-type nickel/cobalt efflux system permease component RcnA
MSLLHFSENAGGAYWVYLAWAVVLGALHGLEPGHSKGLMAAFIIGTRGSYPQAILLALSATVSHTAIVWLLAWPASYGGALWSGQEVGPYLNLASGIVILILSFWMLRRFNRVEHSHSHDDGHRHLHDHAHDHGHSHGRQHEDTHAPAPESSVLEDAHTLAHAREIAVRFSGQHVTTPQVILFGLGSGLAPCTAAVVILIGCFRLHRIWMGFGLVTAFSAGLGLTLTVVAATASWGVRFFGNRWNRFEELMQRAPQLSALFTACIGICFIIAFFRSHIWAS